MRSWMRVVGMAGFTAVLAACGVAGGEPTEAGLPKGHSERLLVSTATGLVVVDPDNHEVVVAASRSVASGDGGMLFRADARGADTSVRAIETGAGETVWSATVAGQYEPRLADRTGSAVVLGPPLAPGSSPYLPAGRESTPLAVLRHDGSVQELVLDGNLEPEAFTSDGNSIFVISYLPPLAPTEYQVRRLDLTTGEVLDVFSVDKQLQEAMGGTARTQAWAPDGRRLYTMYTVGGTDDGTVGKVGEVHAAHQGEGTERKAFIHVLSQDEQWAHCVDLPQVFATAPEDGVALTVSPDGKRLHVADRASGTVAVVDTDRLAVTRTVHQTSSGEVGPAFAAAGAVDGVTTLWLARGHEVAIVDGTSLGVTSVTRVPEPVVGVTPSADGRRLFVGTPSAVTVIDSRSGAIVDRLRAPALRDVIGVGLGSARLDGGRSTLECAC